MSEVQELPKTPDILPVPPAPPKPKAPAKGSLFARIRRIKHIELYTAVAAIAIMVLIFFSSLGGGAKPDTGGTTLTRMEDNFVRDMERKLETTLSNVRGAGKVDAMVTAVGSATLEIAYNIDEKTITQSGTAGAANTTTTVVKTPVIINGKNGPQPLVLFEIKPKLKGVVIVAGGASNPGVRLGLLRAVQALVSDPSVNIEILARK